MAPAGQPLRPRVTSGAAEIAAAVDSVVAAANLAVAGSGVVVVNQEAADSAAEVNRAEVDNGAAAANRVVEVSAVAVAVERRTLAAVVFKLLQAADASRRQAAVVLSPLPAVVQVGVPWVEARASRRLAGNRPFIALQPSRAPARADNPESPVRGPRDRNAVTRTRSTPEMPAADVPA